MGVTLVCTTTERPSQLSPGSSRNRHRMPHWRRNTARESIYGRGRGPQEQWIIQKSRYPGARGDIHFQVSGAAQVSTGQRFQPIVVRVVDSAASPHPVLAAPVTFLTSVLRPGGTGVTLARPLLSVDPSFCVTFKITGMAGLPEFVSPAPVPGGYTTNDPPQSPPRGRHWPRRVRTYSCRPLRIDGFDR